jgi:hypothetical protein
MSQEGSLARLEGDRMNKLAILILVLLFAWLGVRFALPPSRRK